MKLKYKFAVQQVLDQYCAVAVGQDALRFDGMLRFNETGKIMFDLLRDGTTEEEILAALKQTYACDEQHIREDIHRFVSQLREVGVIEE